MSQRINIVLPESTVRTIDRLTQPGKRSRFIDDAVRHFVAHRSSEALRAQLEMTAVRDQDLDREISAEWAAVDNESWHRLEQERQPASKPIRGAAKSTSRRLTRP